jgi:hypothetical protein
LSYAALTDWFCTTEEKSAYCAVHTKSYKAGLFLQQLNGQWLVPLKDVNLMSAQYNHLLAQHTEK